jgi:phosphopantothenoylcysteine decarboxylase/phosphopantothenate--cysteine ligase
LILIRVGASSGSLAVPAVARELAAEGHRVEVILQGEALLFVGPAAFGGASLVDEPSETPEAVLFAPATTNTMARLGHGLGSGYGKRAILAPDLDAATAGHPVVRENMDLLRTDGHLFVEGQNGGMAGAGEIVARLLGSLGGPMEGLRVLVTAGGTREPIDSVRFIGNRSSGKMGLAVAREAARRGAEVTVIAANIESVEPGTESFSVETVDELQAEVLERAGRADALVMAAAVSDFKPSSPVGEKIRRREGTTTLELAPTADVLGAVTERYPDLFVVGFAATHGDPLADAREKLESKGVDLVVGNDISGEGVGFGADENEVYVVGRGEERFVPRASKREVAGVILDTMFVELEKERQR